MNIGFVGLGSMGEPMALLLKAGHHVTVYNRTREKAAPLQAQGATIAGSPREAGAEAVVSMLADDAAVHLSRELATEHARRGQTFFTAVLGRLEAVEAKKAWILAGGAAQTQSSVTGCYSTRSAKASSR